MEEDEYFGQEAIDDPKIITCLSLLLALFDICRDPNCGSAVDASNKKWSFSGAMITITATCNNNHTSTWRSSTLVGSGKSKVAEINILIGTYTYRCGVNVKKVILNIRYLWICLFTLD